MAHNLHLIVVRAESGLDACNEAEDLLFDFGTENNWRSMCGAVSEDNEVYLNGEGRYEPDEKSDTIEKINFDLMQKRTKMVYFTACEIANRDEMLKRDIPLNMPSR